MKSRDDLERNVLQMWLETRIPLTRNHIATFTGTAGKTLDKVLDKMVVDGLLDVDLDAGGTREWRVRGVPRPLDAPDSFTALERRQQIKQAARQRVRRQAAEKGLIRLDPSELPAKPEPESDASDEALVVRRDERAVEPRGAKSRAKNVWISGGASLVFGPVGWLYAGSWREAVPAAAAYLAIAAVVPKILLAPIAGIALPASGIVGLIYAWQYNRKGKRQTLFLNRKRKQLPKKPDDHD